jgi:hypothetical protein
VADKASALYLSPGTVRNHLSSVCKSPQALCRTRTDDPFLTMVV